MAVSLSSPSSSTITPVTLNQKMKNDSWVYGTFSSPVDFSLRRNVVAVSAITGASGTGTGRERLLISDFHVMDASGVSLVLIGPGSMDQDKEARDDPPIEEILKARAISTVHPKLYGLDLISSHLSSHFSV
ncbi:unnamed protein product [Brassica napus]|uniref:(rape) hypothetical protein n=1 Tax=Brassica napus TaxID=3708 RepID=A0A817B6F9_BRANA|nr:unnamed protein product [Brassica napus]